jgi:hypothetical protein
VIICEDGIEQSILFPQHTNHNSFGYLNPVSAGFVSIETLDTEIEIDHFRGKSTTFKLKNRLQIIVDGFKKIENLTEASDQEIRRTSLQRRDGPTPQRFIILIGADGIAKLI